MIQSIPDTTLTKIRNALIIRILVVVILLVVDYDTRIDILIDKLNKYKPNKYLDRLILRFEYEEGNTRYNS